MQLTKRDLLAALAAMGAAGPVWASGQGEIAVPMRSALGRRWTPGVIDDADAVRMVFATQAQLFRVADSTVKAAHLQPLPLRSGDQRLYRAGLIGLGGAYGFRQVEVIGLPASATEPLFHVLIPVLQDAPSLYDFAAGRFVVGWAGSDDFASLRMPSVGLGREPWMRQPALDVELDGMPLRLKIDTTSPYGVSLDPAAVERLGLWNRWSGGYDRVADNEGSADRGGAVQVRRAGQLKIMDWSLDGPVVGLRGPRDGYRPVAGIDGVVGMDVLSRFAVGIEPSGWRLRLRRNPGGDAPFRHDRAGVQAAWRSGRHEVVVVDAGSPAEAAGVRVGDVAGWPDVIAAETFEWTASDPHAASVDLVVTRDGQPVPLRIALVDRL